MRKIFTYAWIAALLLSNLQASAQNGLFISEVTDPADDYTGRFIELFNPGNEPVDFDTDLFYLTRQSNGGTTWGELQLTGSVAPNQTYVIGGSAFESIYGFAPDLVTGILTGNGDDPYSLYSGGGHLIGILHDIYGDTDTDGTGTAWEYTDSRALRNIDVTDPRIPWSSLEWTITSANIADCDPGTHFGSTPVDPIPGDFALRIINDTVESGQTVEVHIAVNELAAVDNIISYQFDLSYDPSVLNYNGVSVTGTIAEGGTLADNNGTAGEISVSYMNTTPITGSGNILVVQFNSLSVNSTELTLSNAFLNNIPVSNLVSGTLVIAETVPPTAKISYSDSINRLADMLQITATFSEAIDIAVPVVLTLDGAVGAKDLDMVRLSDTVYSYLYVIPRANGLVNVSVTGGVDLWGNAVVAKPVQGSTFSILEFRPGDVNDDGDIQAYDAALALQHSVGLDPLPEEDPLPWENWRDSTANVDGSGTITAYDAGLILQYSAGVISEFLISMKKAGSQTEVSVEVVDGVIIILAEGNLVGINIDVTSDPGVLGAPVVSGEYLMSAFNHEGGIDRIGLCTAFFPAGRQELVRIPFQQIGMVTLDMLINAEAYSQTIDLGTGTIRDQPDLVRIYPNPADEMLTVSGLKDPKRIRIFNVEGRVLFEANPAQFNGEIDVSGFEAGVYFLRLETVTETIVKRLIVE